MFSSSLKRTSRVRVSKKDAVLGPPVVTPDAIYVGSGEIYKLSLEKLETLWSRRIEHSTPGFELDRVLVAADGIMHVDALDASTGESLWSGQGAGVYPWRNQILSMVPGRIVLLAPETGELLDQIDVPGPSKKRYHLI